MKKKNLLSKISLVINKQLSPYVIKALNNVGVNRLYTEAGRTSILKEKKGLTLLIDKINLEFIPIEIISFYIPKKQEEPMLYYLYSELDYKTPGRGTLISQDILMVEPCVQCPECTELNIPERQKAMFFREIKGLCCILQRGEEDRIAKASLDMGTSVPITTYGEGSGVRDKLGLLRITISKEKALINLAVSNYDVDPVMELFISEGKLDEPGRGIAFIYDIKQGIIDTKITSGKSGQVASIEQVVYALDAIKGGMGWRKSKFDTESYKKRLFLNNLLEINLVCDEGMGTYLATTAMEHGAPGATISRTKYLSTVDNDVIPTAREICKMIISANNLPEVVASIDSAGGFSGKAHSFLYTIPVTKAFTYIAKKK